MKITFLTPLLFSAFCLITLNSCSDAVSSSKIIDDIEFEVSGEKFTVTNTAKQPVYYYVTETSLFLLASFLWGPFSTDDNKIDAGQKATFPFSEVLHDSQDGEISFFYWYDIYDWDNRPSYPEDIQQVVIDPKTKKVNKK